ncbi:putative tRNA ribosyl transferase [Sulfolobus islandicus rod-shaped virus]|nr:putative tRNA ribosyl transferase [Sulfolobus islandicus rod-shaped virus]
MKLIFGISGSKSYLFQTNFPILANQLKLKRINWKNETWIDSGGFQIIMHNLKISVNDVLQKYKSVNAYAFFSLDIPSIFSPIDKRNFQYFEYLYTKIEWIEKIIPVLHLYPIQDIDLAIDFYKQYSYYFAIGGIMTSSKMKVLIYTFPWIYYIKRKVPYLHVLGMSSPYFLQIFNNMQSMDTAICSTISAFKEIIWFDGSRKYVGNMKTKRERYKISKEETEELFEFLDKHNFSFEYNLNDNKILEMINVYMLLYNNWKIKNKYTEYANKLRKMGIDSLTTELIRNYKIANEILKEKKNKKKKEDELDLEI